jgi:hypothetical protein
MRMLRQFISGAAKCQGASMSLPEAIGVPGDEVAPEHVRFAVAPIYTTGPVGWTDANFNPRTVLPVQHPISIIAAEQGRLPAVSEETQDHEQAFDHGCRRRPHCDFR